MVRLAYGRTRSRFSTFLLHDSRPTCTYVLTRGARRHKLTRVHVSPSDAWEVQSRVFGVLGVAPGAVPAANFSLTQDADSHEAQGFIGYLRWLGAKCPRLDPSCAVHATELLLFWVLYG